MHKVTALISTAAFGLAFAAAAANPEAALDEHESSLEKLAGAAVGHHGAAAPPDADEIYGRFVAYADSINTRSDVTLESLRSALRVPIDMRDGYAFHGSDDLASGLYYLIRFVPKSSRAESTFRLEFGESSAKDGRLSALCTVDSSLLQKRLVGMGYHETVIPDEIGRIGSVRYWRNEIELWVTYALVHKQGRDMPSTMCVESISMFR